MRKMFSKKQIEEMSKVIAESVVRDDNNRYITTPNDFDTLSTEELSELQLKDIIYSESYENTAMVIYNDNGIIVLFQFASLQYIVYEDGEVTIVSELAGTKLYKHTITGTDTDNNEFEIVIINAANSPYIRIDFELKNCISAHIVNASEGDAQNTQILSLNHDSTSVYVVYYDNSSNQIQSLSFSSWEDNYEQIT